MTLTPCKLTWTPPRKIRRDNDDLYPSVRHWLVDQEGRILACVDEPKPNNEEDSFDVRLYYTMTDDIAYFLSLEHAQAWAVKRVTADAFEEQKKKSAIEQPAAIEAAK